MRRAANVDHESQIHDIMGVSEKNEFTHSAGGEC